MGELGICRLHSVLLIYFVSKRQNFSLSSPPHFRPKGIVGEPGIQRPCSILLAYFVCKWQNFSLLGPPHFCPKEIVDEVNHGGSVTPQVKRQMPSAYKRQAPRRDETPTLQEFRTQSYVLICNLLFDNPLSYACGSLELGNYNLLAYQL